MKFSWLIARKYFWSKDKKNFINIISVLSMLVVAISTMALVVILSVFNGLEGLLKDLYGSFDPDVKIEAKIGKSFIASDSLINKIKNIDGVQEIVYVVEDNAYLKYENAELVGVLKGVSRNFLQINRLEDKISDGELRLWNGNLPMAVVGQGVQFNLALVPGNDFVPLQVYYPKNLRSRSLDPNSALSRRSLQVSGAFAIERQFDEKYVLVPMEFMQDIMGYDDNQFTAIELTLTPGVEAATIRLLKEKLSDKYSVLGADEQHAVMLRTVKIEKLFVFITFSFILGVSSINIFFALSMLAIDKKRDLKMFFNMGASENQVRKIFIAEGAIISLSGALVGLILGYILCWLQQEVGLIGMGLETAVVNFYPVSMEWQDFAATSSVVAFITILAALRPATMAVRYGRFA